MNNYLNNILNYDFLSLSLSLNITIESIQHSNFFGDFSIIFVSWQLSHREIYTFRR